MTDIKIFGRWLEAPDKTDTSYTAIRKVIKSEINIPVYIWYDGDAYTTNAEELGGPYSFYTLGECKQSADQYMRTAGCIICETEDEENKYRLLL